MSKKIKIVMVPVDRAPYVTNVSDTLENLQKLVGGYIKTVRFCTDLLLIVNEEGVIRDLPVNETLHKAFGHPFRGDAFFVSCAGEEFVGIKDDFARLLLSSVKKVWQEAHADD